ncbi:hypothetical protein [Segnochrobactrum spirostomi]|uniref:Uncharacterized protein n=1 Tax=Segnochrobactrum spirostomi TaxID=2608987 RepID=A0A6A7Y4U0_9HYPH|nr:hypothetical protein [Segnochrobactrum spirostomi]MQT12719.1 hypothetical protein [Segnochrobactrum spirostomi]
MFHREAPGLASARGRRDRDGWTTPERRLPFRPAKVISPAKTISPAKVISPTEPISREADLALDARSAAQS